MTRVTTSQLIMNDRKNLLRSENCNWSQVSWCMVTSLHVRRLAVHSFRRGRVRGHLVRSLAGHALIANTRLPSSPRQGQPAGRRQLSGVQPQPCWHDITHACMIFAYEFASSRTLWTQAPSWTRLRSSRLRKKVEYIKHSKPCDQEAQKMQL